MENFWLTFAKLPLLTDVKQYTSHPCSASPHDVNPDKLNSSQKTWWWGLWDSVLFSSATKSSRSPSVISHYTAQNPVDKKSSKHRSPFFFFLKFRRYGRVHRGNVTSATCCPSPKEIDASDFLKKSSRRSSIIQKGLTEYRTSFNSLASTSCGVSYDSSREGNNKSFIPLHRKSSRSLYRTKQTLRFDHIEVRGFLGFGAFGRVYLVKRKGAPQASCYMAMKVLNKSKMVDLKHGERSYSEVEILRYVSHPFIVSFLGSYETRDCVFIFMEYVPGGELFSLVQEYGVLSNDATKFYAAELVLTLSYLHSKGIIFRDLKLENILLDAQGHIKLVDFGFAKPLAQKTWTICGTPEYLAPEILLKKGHSFPVDWWALGVLLYECLTGFPPFQGENVTVIYQKILANQIHFPKSFNPQAKDLIKQLLHSNPHERLGCCKNGVNDILQHPWFSSINWNHCYCKRLTPPYRVQVKPCEKFVPFKWSPQPNSPDSAS